MLYNYNYHQKGGEISLLVTNPDNGKEIFRQDYPNYIEDQQTGELIEGDSLFSLGIIKGPEDVNSLEKYLKKQGIISNDDSLCIPDQEDASFEAGGEVDIDALVRDAYKKYNLSESERAILKTARNRIEFDVDKTVQLANKIAANDGKERKVEHVAEAIHYAAGENELLYGRLEAQDLGDFISNGKLYIANVERMDELGILSKEGKEDIKLMKEFEKRWNDLNLSSPGRSLIKTVVNRFLTEQAREDSEYEYDNDTPFRFAIKSLNKVLDEAEQVPEKERVPVIAEQLSILIDSIEKKVTGLIDESDMQEFLAMPGADKFVDAVKKSKSFSDSLKKIKESKPSKKLQDAFLKIIDPSDKLSAASQWRRFYDYIKSKKKDQPEQKNNSLLKDVESTKKALSELDDNKNILHAIREELPAPHYGMRRLIDKVSQSLFFKVKGISESDFFENKVPAYNSSEKKIKLQKEFDKWVNNNYPEIFAEAYHKAKSDNSNPELIESIENLLNSKNQKDFTYSVNEVEKNTDYKFTGEVINDTVPSFSAMQKMAYKLDYKHSDLSAFRTGNNEWSVFVKKDAEKGYKSEALLPGGGSSKENEKLQIKPDILPKDGSDIHIHMPKMGHFPAQDIVLKYVKANFVFNVYMNGKKVTKIGEKNVLSNIENGTYVLKDKNEKDSAILDVATDMNSGKLLGSIFQAKKYGTGTEIYNALKKSGYYEVDLSNKTYDEILEILQGELDRGFQPIISDNRAGKGTNVFDWRRNLAITDNMPFSVLLRPEKNNRMDEGGIIKLPTYSKEEFESRVKETPTFKNLDAKIQNAIFNAYDGGILNKMFDLYIVLSDVVQQGNSIEYIFSKENIKKYSVLGNVSVDIVKEILVSDVEANTNQMIAEPIAPATEDEYYLDKSFHIRDTLVDKNIFNALPIDRRMKILELKKEFANSGYIDVRTELGPDQAARMSQKAKDRISNAASRVFRIEQQVKQLLKSDAQMDEERKKQLEEKRQENISYIKRRIKLLEDMYAKKINSPRPNNVNREHKELKEKLQKLESNFSHGGSIKAMQDNLFDEDMPDIEENAYKSGGDVECGCEFSKGDILNYPDTFSAHNGNKVVDQNGHPLLVYHGTKRKFDRFEKQNIVSSYSMKFGDGFYFTEIKKNAEYYAKESNGSGRARILYAFVDLKNPLVVSSELEYDKIVDIEKSKRIEDLDDEYIPSKRNTKILEEAGYDGVIFEFVNKKFEIIVFDEKNIFQIGEDLVET